MVRWLFPAGKPLSKGSQEMMCSTACWVHALKIGWAVTWSRATHVVVAIVRWL